MKRLIWLMIPILMVSCSPDYHNKITQRMVGITSCSMTPITDSLKLLIDSGFFNVDTKHAGNPMICDSVYKVEFTTFQKWDSGHKGFLIAGILVLLIGFGIAIYMGNKGTKSTVTISIIIGTMLIGGPLVGAFYFFNTEREIKKMDYVHYMQKDGDLHTLWTLPAQSY